MPHRDELDPQRQAPRARVAGAPRSARDLLVVDPPGGPIGTGVATNPPPMIPPLTRTRLLPEAVAPVPAAGVGDAQRAGLPKKRRAWSVQVHAILLVLAVALPLGAIIAFLEWRELGNAEAQAFARAQNMARVTARDADQLIERARIAMETLSRDGALLASQAGRCPPIFAQFPGLERDLTGLLMTDAAGVGICASDPRALALSYANAPWFTSASTGSPVVIQSVARTLAPTGWHLPVAMPVVDGAGAVKGVLATGIDVAAFGPTLQRALDLPHGSAAGLVDDHGTIVARSSDPHRVGGPASRQLVRHLVPGGQTVWRGIDFQGIEAIYAVAPLADVPWFAVVSVPAEAMLGPTWRTMRTNALALVAIVVGVLVIAILALRRMMHPIEALAGVVGAAAEGDWSRRARTDRMAAEVASIGTRVNQMLDRVQRDEVALRESEARFRQLIETSNDAVVIFDDGGAILFASPATHAVFGWAPDDLVGRDVSMLQPQAHRSTNREAMARYARERAPNGQRRSVEATALHREGYEFPVEVAYSTMELAGERVFAAFVRDISARKRAEQVLRDNELSSRELADNAPAMIWATDAERHGTFNSARLLEFTGLTAQQMVGPEWIECVHPEDRARVRETIDRAVAQREPYETEYRVRRHDGVYRWFSDRGMPHFDADGRYKGFVGSCIDVHERVVAEQRLRDLTALYEVLAECNEAIARERDERALFARVCDVIIRHGRLRAAWVGLVDERRTRMTTVASAGASYGLFDALSLALDGSDPLEGVPLLRAFRSGHPYVSNERLTDPATRPLRDQPAHVELRSSAALPLLREGEVVGVLSVYAGEPGFFNDDLLRLLVLLADDLSFALDNFAMQATRTRAEAALRQLNATLEERVRDRTRSLEIANHELEAFSYSVSHDLRAPLRSIHGFTDLLQESAGEALDETSRHYLSRVKGAATRMSKLIDDLLGLSRVARADLARRDIDLSALAAEIVAELADAEPGRCVDVRIEPALTAYADPGLARALLQNLIGNAWKFTAHRPVAYIEVGRATSAGDDTSGPSFVVRDNGAGFDPAHADKLFSPFQRLHSEREFPGNGIGLAIVQRIVRRHGGDVSAESAPEQGATFRFSLGTGV